MKVLIPVIIITLFFLLNAYSTDETISTEDAALSSISEEEQEQTEDDFEFLPMTFPLVDDQYLEKNKTNTIIFSSTGTAISLGLIIYGLEDMISQTQQGYFSPEFGRGIFCISLGLVVSGVSVTFLRKVLDF